MWPATLGAGTGLPAGLPEDPLGERFAAAFRKSPPIKQGQFPARPRRSPRGQTKGSDPGRGSDPLVHHRDKLQRLGLPLCQTTGDSMSKEVTTEPSDNSPAWYSQTTAEVAAQLQSRFEGLTQGEVSQRQAQFGLNQLPEPRVSPVPVIFLRQFRSPLIYVLLAAAAVSAAIGDLEDAIFITIVLVANATIGAFQEWRAERSGAALKKLMRIRATVSRDGEVREIDGEELVPGDIVWIESGNRIPADLRLLRTQNVTIDESLLTGETEAVNKDHARKLEAPTILADRINMAFAGSLVARGRAKGIVVATGTSTAVGQLALDILGEGGGQPPLLERMERFTRVIAIATLVASIIIGALGMLIGGYKLIDTFFLVVALAVSAIPEGLPVAMTVALSVATTRMAHRNVIVRRLAAVEGLGSCTLIATDKTGTLTCNELTAREIQTPDGTTYRVSGEGYAPLGNVTRAGKDLEDSEIESIREILETGILCNEADLHRRDGEWSWRGDAVDVALLSLALKVSISQHQLLEREPEVGRIAFESERRFAASFRTDNGIIRIHAKGAPESILSMCTAPDPATRLRWERTVVEMAGRGLRVLALARGESADVPDDEASAPNPQGLRLLGFVGMIDPLRPGARQAIADCRQAGVEVMMLTGDHRLTAASIARELGLIERDDQIATAEGLDRVDDERLDELTSRVRVFARVAPRQKLRIVESAQRRGHFVAVTGDGVNDGPALRAANIGVAMGRSGTDVAREAAELVIADDRFESIVAGIEEGRIAYDNLRKVIALLISTCAAELLMVAAAVICGMPIPLLPVQLLWLNLVTDGIQAIGLAFEPGDTKTLRRPPRPPSEPIFDRLMIERMLASVLVMGLGGFALFAGALRAGWDVPEARNLLLLTMVLFENFHVGNCRSETRSLFALSPLRNPLLFFGTLGTLALHVVAMYLPGMQQVLETSPIGLDSWASAFGVAVLVIPAVEIHKYLRRPAMN